MVSTSQAEATNCPTHATESPAGSPNTYSGQARLISFRFVSNFVMVILQQPIILRHHSITYLWTGRKCVVHWYAHDHCDILFVYTVPHIDERTR